MSDMHSEQARNFAYVRKTEAPLLEPPASQIGWRAWMRQNVFASMTDFSSIGASILSLMMIALTIGIIWFFVPMIWNLISFSFLEAAWADPEGLKRLVCATTLQGGERAEDWFGACWPMVDAKWKLYVYGRYPDTELWRPNLCFLILGLGVGWCVIDAFENPRAVGAWLIAFGAAMGVIYFLRHGGLPTGATEDATTWELIQRGELLWTRTGFLIPTLIGLLYVVIGRPMGRGYVALFLVAVFPLIAFLLLTGGDLEVGHGFWVTWGGAAIVLLALGWAGGRGMAGEAMSVFSGLFTAFGWVLVAVVAAVFLNSSVLVDLVESMNGHVTTGPEASYFGASTHPEERLSWPLPVVETSDWGGLLVTLVVALTGIVASLPLGVLLALGRRSKLPAVKILSVVFIEFWRGVPLITVLFMSSVMLPLFLPEGTEFNKLLRALIGVALFSSAYMAEVIRGGLQAISKGQYEGGDSLGLSYWQKMRLIILPQALTLVIPGIVNTFIGLFKDTTLVLIIGLFDLLGSVQSSFTDASWSTPVQQPTGYLVAAALFWIFCFGMSRYSMFVERSLHRGHKR